MQSVNRTIAARGYSLVLRTKWTIATEKFLLNIPSGYAPPSQRVRSTTPHDAAQAPARNYPPSGICRRARTRDTDSRTQPDSAWPPDCHRGPWT